MHFLASSAFNARCGSLRAFMGCVVELDFTDTLLKGETNGSLRSNWSVGYRGMHHGNFEKQKG